jgi:hypothetical protein
MQARRKEEKKKKKRSILVVRLACWHEFGGLPRVSPVGRDVNTHDALAAPRHGDTFHFNHLVLDQMAGSRLNNERLRVSYDGKRINANRRKSTHNWEKKKRIDIDTFQQNNHSMN